MTSPHRAPRRSRSADRPAPRWLTLYEAANYVSLSRATLYRQAALGRLDLVRVGGRTLVAVAELDRFMARETRRGGDRGA